MAPLAQEILIDLEKSNAPIIEQIRQASLFAQVSFSEITSSREQIDFLGAVTTLHQASSHGRQEYCLRWLLKKLQDGDTRWCTEAWRLLRLLIERIPLRNLARVLNEKKFLVILRGALEESSLVSTCVVEDSSDTAVGSPVEMKPPLLGTRKRKREDSTLNHRLTKITAVNDEMIISNWKLEVYEIVHRIVQLSNTGSDSQEISTSEYMKSVIRTSNYEAARILGAWLFLFAAQKGTLANRPGDTLLSPFLLIWNSRIVGTEDAKAFSEHCLIPTLTIMSEASQGYEETAQLEKLLASNIIVPAKMMHGSLKETKSLATLVSGAVSKNSARASIIFEISVRCIQPHGSRPRGVDDNTWLQAVFGVLEEAMSKNISSESVTTLKKMLQYCIDHKIALDLPFLRLLTSKYGLTSGETNWDLVATIIELDPNAFLISSKPEELLKNLLTRITKASAEITWPIMVDLVVDGVLIPLMCEFAKARQLVTFIQHWYQQLVEVDKIQIDSPVKVEHFSAWEDEALRPKLGEILEPSLTTLQISEIVEWLIGKLAEGLGPSCLLLDAVAEAISNEDTRAAVHSTLIDKVINVVVYNGLDDRYKSRLLHLNTVVLNWSSGQIFNNTTVLDGHSPLFLGLLSSKISFSDNGHSLIALEAFRYLCAQWSIGAPIIWNNVPAGSRNCAGVEILSNYITSTAQIVRELVEHIGDGDIGSEQKWGKRVIKINRGLEWLACAYASCILVEYPKVLELCIEGRMLTDFIWLASTTTISSSLYEQDPWLPLSQAGLSSLWMEMLGYNGYVENNKPLSQNIIKRMIECSNHAENPIERSNVCNGFVVMCFHHLPIDLLSRDNREAVLNAWPSKSSGPFKRKAPSISFKMDPLDPAVLSLRAKMQRRPTLYDGIKFKELVDLAESIETSQRQPKVQLEIFAEIPELILGHVFATIDQIKSREYIQGTIEVLENWLEVNRGAKKALSYIMTQLTQIVFMVWSTKDDLSDEFLAALKKSREDLSGRFKSLLLSNLQRRLQKPEKLNQQDYKHHMSLCSTLDALDAIGVGEYDLVNLRFDAISTLDSLMKSNLELGERFELFMIEHCPTLFKESPKNLLRGDVATFAGREGIRRKAMAVTDRMTELEKLRLVAALVAEIGDEQAFDRLLALKYVIASCEDSRTITPEEDENLKTGLSSSYSALATQLLKSHSVRRCRLICKIMEMILREKPKAITQYNIDTTLANIAVICSPDSPNLNPSGASTIYNHLVKLVNTILTSHRLKTKGHFHVVVQTLQPLLYCLFIPSSIGTYKSKNGSSFPSWLDHSSKALETRHAETYARLLTLICDPSVSAVSRPSSSSLNSATKRAKALAGQHMPFVLSTYIRAELDMSLSMKQGIKQALVPGWYAIFDTMTVESRKALGESLDASGRAILSSLIKDWVRFGKWNGI